MGVRRILHCGGNRFLRRLACAPDGRRNRFGRFLDPLADKFLTIAAFVCFIYLNLIPLWMVAVVVSRDIAVTSLRIYAERKNRPMTTMKSAKWKTFLQLIFIFYTLILLTGSHTAWIHRNFSGVIDTMMNAVIIYSAMLALTIMSVVTGVIYIIENRLLFRSSETQPVSSSVKS